MKIKRDKKIGLMLKCDLNHENTTRKKILWCVAAFLHSWLITVESFGIAYCQAVEIHKCVKSRGHINQGVQGSDKLISESVLPFHYTSHQQP